MIGDIFNIKPETTDSAFILHQLQASHQLEAVTPVGADKNKKPGDFIVDFYDAFR